MIDNFFGANLIDSNTCKVALFSSVQKADSTPINLIINDETVVRLDIKKQVFLSGIAMYTCYFKDGFKLGNSYKISIENYGIANLNVSEIVNTPSFDDEYFYPNDDLGVTYTKENTTFKLWAPLASKVEVLIRRNFDEEYTGHYLKRGEKGVYSITLNGDYENYHYVYVVTNNEIPTLTTDPYGKASVANGKENVVIDLNKTKIDMHESNLPVYKSYLDTIIYELDVRDFTIDENTDIEHKGKYLGLTEENRKTKGRHEAGLDYLASLGITHVQILPIYDFKTIDENHPLDSYNWGYDPQQYFVPEGSYSTDPNNGYSRVIECKKMIAALHKKGLKVNMDVVYNHVFEGLFSSFEHVVPGYFFRKRKDGTLCNGTGCGNDVDSERLMVRKLIVDCCKFWCEEYSIDGLRFDLMGILDVNTINRVVKVCRAIKPDFMVYGEGWDMNTELKSEKKASILNSFKMEDVAFFNDTYRDTLKGPNGTDKLLNGGYLTGNQSYVEGFKFAFLSSSLNYVYPARFKFASQSLNYVECHDNFTIFDKVSSIYGKNNEEKVLDIIKQINGTILLSIGIPFFHAGQEVGLTKYYEDNTYNKGDHYNKFRWDVLDKRYEMVTYLKSMIDFKKNIYKVSEEKPENIAKMINFAHLEQDLLEIFVKALDGKEYIIILNPTDNRGTFVFDDYYKLICGQAGYLKGPDLYIKNSTIEPHCVSVFLKKEAE